MINQDDDAVGGTRYQSEIWFSIDRAEFTECDDEISRRH
jgi:hypothetical protein